MKLQQLRLFHAACLYQNAKKAADALNMSQSSILHAINELEAEFGVTLLAQKGRAFALTKEGEAFSGLCGNLLAQAKATERAMHEVAEQREKIHIGMTPMIRAALLSTVEAEIKEKSLGMELQCYELGGDSIRKRLQNGQLDCAICIREDTDRLFFESVHLGETRYVCCVGKDHPLAEEFHISMSQLKEEPVVVFEETLDSRHNAIQVFEREGIELNVVVETNQLETVRNLVVSGKAIGILYKEYAALYPGQMVSIPIDGLENNQAIDLIWPKTSGVTASMAKAIPCLSAIRW